MSAPYVTGSQPGLNETLDSAKALDRYLTEAISDLAPKKGHDLMSNGLRRLKSLSESLRASLDTEADKAAADIQAAHEQAIQATHDLRDTIGSEFKKSANEVKDMLNQITNGEPNG